MTATTVLPVPSPGRSGAGLGDRPAMSLSPSRAGDFLTCPLLYRFRVVDRLPEPPSQAAVRGTLVHAVLERLFDLPAAQRTPAAAVELVTPAWEAIVAAEPGLPAELLADPADPQEFLAECAPLIDRYFAMEDPRRLEPAERELSVSVELETGLVLRGIIDRIDRSPSGLTRVVDYKTGRAPGPGWEAKAMFQMRFYALVLWRLTGEIPARLQLLYIGSGERLTADPGEGELRATQAKLQAVWNAIAIALETATWQPRPSRLCGWCSFKPQCPEWSGPGNAGE